MASQTDQLERARRRWPSADAHAGSPAAKGRADATSGRSLRAALGHLGFTPLTSKLKRPEPGVVPRASLIERVRAAHPDVLTVTAPAGYGKSAFVAALTDEDPRPTAWVSLSPSVCDPASMLTHVAVALDTIEPVMPEDVKGLWDRPATPASSAMRRFGAMLGGRRTPFVLVLDDVHEVSARAAREVIGVVLDELPAGSTLVLCSRSAMPLRLGSLRLHRHLVEVDTRDLAFDVNEAAHLFEHLRVAMTDEQVGSLVAVTEGWPTALRLAVLADSAHRAEPTHVAVDFPSDHGYLMEYLDDELLSGMDDDMVTFLTEASCLDPVSGTLCDAALGRTGSAALLEAAHRQHLVVIPLDGRRESYRIHHLLAEVLQSRLSRRDPVRRAGVHRAASRWYDEHGDPDVAITYAARAGDFDEAEAIVQCRYPATGSRGPSLTAAQWRALFPRDELMRRPFLMVIAAWSAFGAGDATAAHDWLRRAAAVVDGDTRRAPGLCAARVALATARCFIAPAGSVEQSSEVAQLDGDIGCDETRAVASLELGVAALIAGDVDDARRRLTAGANTHAEHPLAAANCLALLALLEIEQGRWTRAVQPTAQARSLLGDAEAVPGAAVVLAVDVLVKAHAGDADGLDAERQRCREHLEHFCGLTPWLNLLARVALARAAVLRGDHVEAATMIRQSREMLRAMRGARHVVEQLDDVGLQLTGGRAEARFGPSSLTTAELRVLRLLPTHLTVPEIAHRLCVSRFTVKSQTSSIYRKLGTTTRSGTVEAATTFGLLPSVLTAR